MNNTQDHEQHQIVRSELNLEKWSALFSTSRYQGKSRQLYRKVGEERKVGVIIGQQPDDRGQTIEVGVLRVPDLKAFYGLIRLWELAGKPIDDPVQASFRELVRLLGKSWGSKAYDQTKLSLQRLRRIPIDWVGSFYQKDKGIREEYVSQVNILSVLDIYTRSQDGVVQHGGFAFKFDDRLLRNLLYSHTKPMNLDVIASLKKELSVLIYCHIDLVLADKTNYERKSEGLFQDLAIEGSKYKYPAARKQNLTPVLEELQGVHLSTGTLETATLAKTQDGTDWKAVFAKAPFQHRRQLPSKKPQYEIEAVTRDILEVTEDEDSRAFYVRVAKLVPTDLIHRVLGEVKEEWRDGTIRTTKGAVFTDKVKRYCQERGISLGLQEAG